MLLLEEEKMTATRYLPLEITYHYPSAGYEANRIAPLWSLSAFLPQGTCANAAEYNLGPLTLKDFWKEIEDATPRSSLSEHSWVTAASKPVLVSGAVHQRFKHIEASLITAQTLLVSPEMLPNIGDSAHISSDLSYTLACWENKRIKIL